MFWHLNKDHTISQYEAYFLVIKKKKRLMEGKLLFYTERPRKVSMVRDEKGKEEPAMHISEGKFSRRRKQLVHRSWGRCKLTY